MTNPASSPPLGPVARPDAEIERDAMRWRFIRKQLIRDTWSEDDEPNHTCTIVQFKDESISAPGWFRTIEEVVDDLIAFEAELAARAAQGSEDANG